ncbi:3a64c354-4cae-449d-8ad4-99325f8fd276 [Thermothielavioides terrestris]|uniref:3a64c354-4cae-449d-8ad4-99325f8fd276 n=1 Tax=Thermothielavioides terrestris TaxID=2587410 RepID=A0A446BBC1_9PEZI|nr:3a64c354-4cae-449d-8ad4-99325f8fd276 [Thermothielavioides terrestris]
MLSTVSSRPVPAGATSASSGRCSAPVLEFVCLFTHDLRRKQKRWEDGRLKYHTFNKRVMVYDERGNFVGDMHWQRESEFGEGEEFQLERGGAIVQAIETVLRLKPRQKRGLLLLSEKRKKNQQLKGRSSPSREQIHATDRPATPVHDKAAELHTQVGHKTANHTSIVSRGDSTAPSFADLGEAPAPGDSVPDAEDEPRDQSIPPQREKRKQKAKRSAKLQERARETASPDMQGDSSDDGHTVNTRKSARQGQKTRRPSDQVSSHPKTVQAADSEESENEELPQAEVGPHLAPLSRRRAFGIPISR